MHEVRTWSGFEMMYLELFCDNCRVGRRKKCQSECFSTKWYVRCFPKCACMWKNYWFLFVNFDPELGPQRKKETEPEKTTLCFPAQGRKIIRFFKKVEFHIPVIQRRSRYMRHKNGIKWNSAHCVFPKECIVEMWNVIALLDRKGNLLAWYSMSKEKFRFKLICFF